MKLKIGNKQIGEGESCFTIAEAGSNHNGNLEQAKELIDVAAEAKAGAVEFQIFKAENKPEEDGWIRYKGRLLARPIAAGEVEIKV